MQKLLDRTPHQVAPDLIGKTIEVNGKQAVITKALPRTESDNAIWLKRRPLFATKPVDVYVAPYRGSFMLFLRTGKKNTCVRIDSVEMDGKKFVNPGQVCKALGLTEEDTGSVKLIGNTLVLVF